MLYLCKCSAPRRWPESLHFEALSVVSYPLLSHQPSFPLPLSSLSHFGLPLSFYPPALPLSFLCHLTLLPSLGLLPSFDHFPPSPPLLVFAPPPSPLLSSSPWDYLKISKIFKFHSSYFSPPIRTIISFLNHAFRWLSFFNLFYSFLFIYFSLKFVYSPISLQSIFFTLHTSPFIFMFTITSFAHFHTALYVHFFFQTPFLYLALLCILCLHFFFVQWVSIHYFLPLISHTFYFFLFFFIPFYCVFIKLIFSFNSRKKIFSSAQFPWEYFHAGHHKFPIWESQTVKTFLDNLASSDHLLASGSRIGIKNKDQGSESRVRINGQGQWSGSMVWFKG